MTAPLLPLAWIPLFPLLGFLINGLLYLRSASSKAGHSAPTHGSSHGHASSAMLPGSIATAAIFMSFLTGLTLFFQLMRLPPEQRMLEQVLFPWIHVASLQLDATLRLDVLSILFVLVITGIGSLIHLYSIGYMGHDPAPGKFFAYLNLFCFAMLILVMGASLPLLFLGWEGVGLCSYLLIGFWYEDIEKAKAGKKAFVVNRVGDLGFLVGMFLIFYAFGTLDFDALKPAVGNLAASPELLTLIGISLFVGCMGKSAQIPLYVWLPDAMAGPTPVSALIHAATMVTSGIYLVARLNFIFSLSHQAMTVIAVIGGATAFFAATIAIAQRDIKKILAYSTVSQLGYMFLACGVGAYGAGVFHVITHAFFKALMFLGAGSVIHGMHEEQDILKMGGLKKSMPKTFLVFAAGWLAICGVPPFSGFFSKDEILWSAFSSPHGSVGLWALGAVTALMTAFYMTRLFSLTFFGKPRFDPHHVHVHESPMVMVAPLMVLAVLSVIGGFLGIPHFSWLEGWLEPVIGHHGAESRVPASFEWILMAVSSVGAIIVMLATLRFYQNLDRAESIRRKFSWFHRCLENKWYVDELYEWVWVKPIGKIAEWCWRGIDAGVIDRVVNGVGKASQRSGQIARVPQNGSLQSYALLLMTGIILMMGYLIYAMVS